MATRLQLDTLNVIQSEREKAKNAHKNIPEELSGGQKKYKSAINTILSIGWLAEFVAILAGMTLTMLLVSAMAGGTATAITYILYIVEVIACIVTIVLGHKLATLDATPTFVLVSLIIILVNNLALYFGFLPLLNVILAIIGLVRWSTYKDWFDNIDIEKSNENEGGKE